ncbi:MAG: hypothetical protein AABZ67_00615 [Pseudomonadota bacterium]
MALTATQIITLAVQTAKCPGYTSQAGQFFNAILEELAFTYDFDLSEGSTSFAFNPALISTSDNPNISNGMGPYPLPANFLRAIAGDAMWFLQNVPYPLIPIDIAELDQQVTQAGLQSYPYFMAVDMSTSPPGAYFYPAPSGVYTFFMRYRKKGATIATPESSGSSPWFPMDTYMVTRLSGELMKITGDTRWETFLGDGPAGAQGMLLRYLKMKDNQSNRSQTVKLDGRRFKNNFSSLPSTKLVGW